MPSNLVPMLQATLLPERRESTKREALASYLDLNHLALKPECGADDRLFHGQRTLGDGYLQRYVPDLGRDATTLVEVLSR